MRPIMEATPRICGRKTVLVVILFVGLQGFIFVWIWKTESRRLPHETSNPRTTFREIYPVPLTTASWRASEAHHWNHEPAQPAKDNVKKTVLKLVESHAIVRSLVVQSQRFCNKSVVVLGQHSVIMKDVVLATDQSEERFLNTEIRRDNSGSPYLRRGLLTLNSRCDSGDFQRMISRRGRWEQNWNSYIVLPKSDVVMIDESLFVGVVLKRIEYANVYWTILDLYNVYLALRLFEKPPGVATIILADDHPTGPLDSIWDIFGHCQRLTELRRLRLHVESLIWMTHREYDPLLHSNLPIPLFTEFREFVYSRMGLTVKNKNRCVTSPLNIVVILRRYTSSKSQESKIIPRAILNQGAVLNATRKTFPSFNVQGTHLESVEVTEQFELISKVDILIGVHGAGMAYGAFLQPGAAMLELFPKRYFKQPNNHMEILARANRVHYHSWQNQDPSLEDETDSIKLPVQEFVDILTLIVRKLCK